MQYPVTSPIGAVIHRGANGKLRFGTGFGGPD